MSLSIEGITAAYGKRVVLRAVRFEAPIGKVTGIIGPNGAGKSSLLRVISGTLPATAGIVRLEGVDLASIRVEERAKRVAVVPQSSQLPQTFTVGEVVLLGRTPHLSPWGAEGARDYRAAQEAMKRTDLEELAERLVGELSGGEQQRVLIARALAQEPRVLLLDEATAHLDLKHQTHIWGLVRQLARSGLVVLAALHDLNLAAQYADRLTLMREGELLFSGVPEEVLTPEWLRRAYDVETVVSPHPVYRTPMVALVGGEGEGGKRNED